MPFMNLYFSCSLTGGREDEAIYGAMVDYLQDRGFDVPTAHLAHPGVMDLEKVVDPGEVFQRDVEWVQACDALIAEVSTPSHGVGYEIAYALSLGKRVLCCYRRGVPVSKMLSGNDTTGFSIQAYDDEENVLAIIDAFLENMGDG